MRCGRIDAKNHISSQQSLPPTQHKMNENYSAVQANFSYLPSSVLACTRYHSVSIRSRICKSISSWLTSKHSSYAFFFVVFACACLPLNAVSGEYSQPVFDSSTYYNNYNTSTYHNNHNRSAKPCYDCAKMDLETLRNITLEGIKTRILTKLGFKNGTIPNASQLLSKLPPAKFFGSHPEDTNDNRVRHPNAHRYIQNDEAKFDNGYLDDEVKTLKVVAKAKKGESVTMGSGFAVNPLQFTFESLSECRVTNARLFIYQTAKPADHLMHSRKVILSIQKMNIPKSLSINTKMLSTNTKSLATNTTFELKLNENASWHYLDFDENETKRFFNEIGHSLPVQVTLWFHVRYATGNITGDPPLVIGWPKCASRKSESECANVSVPYLQLQIEESNNRRRKRSTDPDCPVDRKKFECCRYPLTVDFREMGWDFIIAPASYNAHYCAGECTYLSQQKMGHTQVTTMSESGQTLMVRPCCSARVMSPITMLYINMNNNIVYGIVPAMVVERCGCQ